MIIAPVLGPSHPRRAGFRDGLLAAGVLLGLALATGVLAVPEGASRQSHVNGSDVGPSVVAGLRTDAPGGDVPRGSERVGDGPATPPQVGGSLPPIDAPTLVYLPRNAYPQGTDMTEGCNFLIDLGPASGGPMTRSCPGRDGPLGPLGTLYAAPGAVLYVESSEFTPSTGPAQPAAACGQVSGQPPVFTENPSCLISYATSTNGLYAFRLPARPGRWVVAVRGCEVRLVNACGAWYAEVDTIDPPSSP